MLKSKLKTIEPGLLNIKDAAGFLGMGVWKLRRLVWSGQLPYIQLTKGAKLQFDVADLRKWIEAQKKKN
jgi:hypothetical protein